MGDSFVHLHVHSEYSLLDGAGRVTELAGAAAELGMPALALTDHGLMYGAIDFYKAALEAGIKPLIGCEVYVARRGRRDREPGLDDNQAHLVLLARDEEGYRNLVELVSRASLEGFYYKPRVDHELLEGYSKGLVALSACLAGEIPGALLAGDAGRAKQVAGWYGEVFPGSFYLELQDHGLPEQARLNRELLTLSRELSLPLVATNDVHYVRREQAPAHDVLLCIQTGKTLQDAGRLRFPTDQFYLRSPEEMGRLFGEVPEALSNSLAIAERCNVRFEFGKLHLPHYELPPGEEAAGYLRRLCRDGLERRYGEPSPEAVQRLEYELDVICHMDYPGYFLIVWDLINFARQKGIPVGPGRGSAAGSLVAYCLGITDIDPLRYGLLFERFLNPERVTMPDIDTDLCFERRDEVIDYVTQKYGADHVAQIVTFGTMAARAAIRDVGRVMNLPLAEVDRVAKLVPSELNITLERALEASPDLKELYQSEPRIQSLLDTARQLEGTPRHASTHAAGIVISREPLTHYLPLQRVNEGAVITQYHMAAVEEIGLLKMDLLGLRTLTVLGQAEELVRRGGMELDLGEVSLDDEPTYKLLGSGESSGVFQLESSGMRGILKRLQPERFEDLVALVALYRPGPLGSGMVDDFIQRKHGAVRIEYLHQALEPILKDSYGVILYQEQVMRIASDLAGFTLGQADLLRRAMGKKKPEIIAAQRENFVRGASSTGVQAEVAGQIFDLMEHFAGYGFNRSHSAAYALVSYRTAYLKAHHTAEFMAALLTSVREHTDKVTAYIEECRRLGLEVLPPDVNESLEGFTVVGNKIRFGLSAVKNVGEGAVREILEAREKGGRFTSPGDFLDRLDLRQVNRRVLESLIRCGALSSLGLNRARLLHMLDNSLEAAQRRQGDRQRGQLSLLDLAGPAGEPEPPAPDLPEFSLPQVLDMEKELLGYYVSGNPLAAYRKQLEAAACRSIEEVFSCPDGSTLTVGGLAGGVRRTVTKKGEGMAYFNLEDTTGQVEVLVFPRIFAQCGRLLENGRVLIVRGRLSLTDERVRLFAEEVYHLASPCEERLLLWPETPNCRQDTLLEVKRELSAWPGPVPVLLEFQSPRRLVTVAPSLWVEPAPALLARLGALIGKDRVKLEAGQKMAEPAGINR